MPATPSPSEGTPPTTKATGASTTALSSPVASESLSARLSRRLDKPRSSVEMLSLDGTPHAVPVTAEPGLELNKVLEYSVFQDWVASIDQDSRLFIENIHVQSLDMFGPRVGFIKFQSTAKVNVGGEKGLITVPGIVFMRGGAVGVLVILECEGQEFTILTNQARVPMGLHDLPEIPAGMLDGSGHFKGVAAEEIAEECNIVISEEELVDLTELAYGGKYKGMIPSAGGCDEFIRLFAFRRAVEPAVLQELQGRLTGLLSEGEHIKLQIIPLNELWHTTPDAKALSALSLFHSLREQGKLPQMVQTVDTRTAVTSVAELQTYDAEGQDDLEDQEDQDELPTVPEGLRESAGSALSSADDGSGGDSTGAAAAPDGTVTKKGQPGSTEPRRMSVEDLTIPDHRRELEEKAEAPSSSTSPSPDAAETAESTAAEGSNRSAEDSFARMSPVGSADLDANASDDGNNSASGSGTGGSRRSTGTTGSSRSGVSREARQYRQKFASSRRRGRVSMQHSSTADTALEQEREKSEQKDKQIEQLQASLAELAAKLQLLQPGAGSGSHPDQSTATAAQSAGVEGGEAPAGTVDTEA